MNDTYGLDNCKAPAPLSPVTRELQRQSEAVDALASRVSELYKKLEPAMSSPEPLSSGGLAAEPVQRNCEISDTIRVRTERLWNLGYQIEDIVSRLAI